MPLNCDCYAGCWKEHSNNWPKVVTTVEKLDELYSKCVKILPYGSYVLLSDQLRVENLDLLYKVLPRCN